ncbi:hypothetical protein GGR52DRAFT_549102 [Hypoxylon sp. FL1284]|nr:hypothetical protein GGR52DRAFT_549102 [Hypoxylon sp. FL1284]
MTGARSASTTAQGADSGATQLKDTRAPIQTQRIDGRYIQSPMKLAEFLDDEYGKGNYKVKMRRNVYTIRAPGMLEWSQICERCGYTVEDDGLIGRRTDGESQASGGLP